MKERQIVTLCGSTRFKEQFEAANKAYTLKGWIVLSVGHYPHQEEEHTSEDIKADLDQLHLDKIDMSDEVFMINPGGYLGYSAAKELIHAWNTQKTIKYLEPQLEIVPDRLKGLDDREIFSIWQRTRP